MIQGMYSGSFSGLAKQLQAFQPGVNLREQTPPTFFVCSEISLLAHHCVCGQLLDFKPEHQGASRGEKKASDCVQRSLFTTLLLNSQTCFRPDVGTHEPYSSCGDEVGSFSGVADPRTFVKHLGFQQCSEHPVWKRPTEL